MRKINAAENSWLHFLCLILYLIFTIFGVQRKGPQGNRCHYENDSDDGNGIPYAKGTGKNQERFGRRN